MPDARPAISRATLFKGGYNLRQGKRKREGVHPKVMLYIRPYLQFGSAVFRTLLRKIYSIIF
jgi:hypothetical protein